MPDERREERVRGIPAERFDRLDRAARRLDGEDEARHHGPAIDQHRAGAAGPDPAPFLGPREVQFLTEQLQQRAARRDGHLPATAVDRQLDPGGRFNGGAGGHRQ